MKKVLICASAVLLLATTAVAERHDSNGSRSIDISVSPQPGVLGSSVSLTCEATGDWSSLRNARIDIRNAADSTLVRRADMNIDGSLATYNYIIPADETAGTWDFTCNLEDTRRNRERNRTDFMVAATDGTGGDTGGGDTGGGGTTPPPSSGNVTHPWITSYDGPQTCINCHEAQAQEMLNSLHMKWAGPTTELSNTNGEELGKGQGGINTFCTYAPSSKGACYGCHVRADGNAPHAPELTDIDCLMCHNDTYQRKFVSDPNNTETVTNVLGETKTYTFGAVDGQGNYTTVPDFDNMPAGTTMVSLAQTVHKPTRKSCLRCHAKAGGGDWTKRGDMGLNTVAPTVEQDVHMSPDSGGANLTCSACHSAGSTGHKVGGRGIDLRETEAADPACTSCHSATPHSDSVINRHAQGQVACQTCHIRSFGKGGATEMSRDWRIPTWNQAFCNGQGGFVGEEIKEGNVKPEYRWFDGTSYVYNVGETIAPNADGSYTMARANGKIFDGKSKIVPVKDHWSIMPLHESGVIVPPSIMWMFMTGDFDLAVEKGMQDFGLTGGYALVDANAEMLITHGVEPKSMAPTCTECHSSSGKTTDGTKMLPFGELGYQTFPAKVASCTLCHSQKTASFEAMHDRHAADGDGSAESWALSCQSCHNAGPTGFTKPTSDLCNDCHSYHNPDNFGSSDHLRHVKRNIACTRCHTF